jgi:hypothetical protein
MTRNPIIVEVSITFLLGEKYQYKQNGQETSQSLIRVSSAWVVKTLHWFLLSQGRMKRCTSGFRVYSFGPLTESGIPFNRINNAVIQ